MAPDPGSESATMLLSLLPLLLAAHPASGRPIHDGMDEAVNGMDDEGDGPEADAGDGPLAAGLRHSGQRPGQPVQRGRAQTVDEKS